METTWSRPIVLRRAPWRRIGDMLLDAAASVPSALRLVWQRRRTRRQRAAEFRALRELSPHVLRDIGVAAETIHQAQRWSDQQDAARDIFLRGL